MSADAGSDGDGPSSADTSDGNPVRKSHKRNKSKGWSKMSLFGRRSRRSHSQTEAGCSSGSSKADDIEDANTSHQRPLSWGSSSSSEGDLAAAALHFKLRKGQKSDRSYPNSEIIEQNCLRPSATRAMFRQLEATSGLSTKHNIHGTKFIWPKKKPLAFTSLDDSDISEHDTSQTIVNDQTKQSCHCLACCNCTTEERLSGQCPAYLQRCTSSRSLDTALTELHYSINFHESDSQDDSSLLESSFLEEDTNPIPIDPKIKRSPIKTQPGYYGQSLLRKCKLCCKVLRQCHLPAATSRVYNLPSLPASLDFCDCKSVQGSKICKTSGEGESYPAYRNKVSPSEFKQKSEQMTAWFADFNDEQKNLFLKQLLSQCDLPQTHLLSDQMGPNLHVGCPPNCQDILTWLPQPLATKILTYLDPVSLCYASGVCQVWQELCNQPALWRAFTCRPAWKLSRAGERKQLLTHMLPNGDIHWKRIFAERYRLKNNWLKGRCTIRTFEGHTQGISCVQFDDTRIVSGSSDKTIKVWNIRTNSPWSVQTLVGHSGTVRCLHLDGNRLVSGSSDRTIKVWDLSTQQSWSSIACKVTMIGHQDTVRCLQVDDEKVISGSYDKTLKIWDIRTGVCTRTLRGHEAAVLCVQFDLQKIVSGSCDKTIKVWSLDGECCMSLRGHQDAVTCLQFDSTRIISGSLDCNLKFWDIKTGRCENTIDWKASEGHTGVVRCLQADSWRVVSASDDKTLKVWSLDTCQRLATLRNHTDGVTCLQFNDNIVVSGSYDKTVILRDFSCV